MFKRPSKLIISMIFDDFYGFNQTFWCSIVGVFLIETHKNFKISILFSKGFCIVRFFFWKITIFMMNCTRWFKIFCIFIFENTHLGIRIDAKSVFFFFFFFCECLWKTHVRWWKNYKNQRFHDFYQFFVNPKMLPGNLILRVTGRFWASSCRG